ncbi:MAG: hypothetical protein DRQ64_00080 [Gammaproteobacteria bacterium]|nr:MAG: hypothetical protein DRQ64_00080 [Gammaproteobacteria bacterium]
MEMTLNALVRSALSEADGQLKLASTQDVVDPMSKLAMPMDLGDGGESSGDDEEDKDKKKSKKKGDDEDEDEEKTSGLNLADHAMKLAEAIDHVGLMWTKQAEAMPTFAGQHNVGDNTQHTKTSPATVPAAQAGSGGGPSENSQGYPAGIDTNASEFKSPEWAGNPEAREGAIRVKGAKPGETAAGKKTASIAAQHRNLLRQHGAKFAADPSSPQAVGISKGKDPGKLDMVPPSPTEIPGNNGMATMTKKKAKTKHVQNDTSKVIGEPAFSGRTDKGISDNLAQNGGNKLAGIPGAALQALEEGAYKNPTLRRALGGGAAGAAAGGLAGANYADPGERGKGALGGAILGGGIGALTGGLHGAIENEGVKGILRGRGNSGDIKDLGRLQTATSVLGGAGAFAGGADAAHLLRAKKQQAAEVAAAEGGKTASQTAAARSYLSKIASQAQNPHASPRMRVKVAKFHNALQRINTQRQG